MKNNKGFVVSAILYPLLVLFLALMMGLLAMSDTRKRILDKMKLEISDSIFDDAECSCDTILNKLNYLIKNGVGGGGGGSYSHNVLGLNVKGYESPDDLPNTGNSVGDIAVITDVEVTSYYVSRTAPSDPKEGNVWIVEDRHSDYYIKSDYSNIGISYAMQYIDEKWILKKTYVFDDAQWKLLYYVSLKGDSSVDLTSSDINAKTEWDFGYTGEYQVFSPIFSGYYSIELWGASGVDYNYRGGNGAYTKGTIYLNAGDTLFIYVGGQGSGATGGWNGGGNGSGNYDTYGFGYGGGGATDVRLVNTSGKTIWNEFDSLKSRIMVAAGGGSAGSWNNSSNSTYSRGQGGDGGGLNGSNGVLSLQSGASSHGQYIGIGAGQGTPGFRNDGASYCLGGFGYGNGQCRNGGGGGWYGGGGGTYGGAAGGGSSYISGYDGCDSIEEESTASNIIHNGRGYHYSGYYFMETVMTGGVNDAPGKAKIILQTIEVKSAKEIKELQEIRELERHYSYSGNHWSKGRYQVFKPTISGTYLVELWGASGADYNYAGGNGAYTKGEIYVNAKDTLYLYIGGQGRNTWGAAGWNGGGNGAGNYSTYGFGYGGGGATDIRLVHTSNLNTWNEFDSLKSRIMVAGGGGSAGSWNNTSNSTYSRGQGGAGGTISSTNGIFVVHSGAASHGDLLGIGAGQAIPGFRNNGATTCLGGFGYASNDCHNGGGGGYYGGGGGTYGGGAAGGSSYISGHNGCNSIEETSTVDHIVHNGRSYHYSGYYFTNTEMQAGINDGHGYAKITLLKKETKTNPEIIAYQEEHEVERNYTYSGVSWVDGRYQIFKPTKTGTYSIELWGASGGDYNYIGGNGAYTYGEIYLNTREILYVYVGGSGRNTWATGGWNGGGSGVGNYSTYGYGYGGGGATDIRLVNTSSLTLWNESDSLKSRIMVAAGGGGAGSWNNTSNSTYSRGRGGGGGGLIGYNGTLVTQSGTSHGNLIGTGATQIIGGHRNDAATNYVGGFGYGSPAHVGGGGGWYGGGGGTYGGAAGGGSSYISGHEGCIGIDGDGSPLASTYSDLSHSISYTTYKFTNTEMVDGNGYPWTPSKSGTATGMPSPTSTSTISGNDGHGHARIRYLGA